MEQERGDGETGRRGDREIGGRGDRERSLLALHYSRTVCRRKVRYELVLM